MSPSHRPRLTALFACALVCLLLPFHSRSVKGDPEKRSKPESCLTFPKDAAVLSFKGGCIAYNEPSETMSCTAECFMGAVFYPDGKADVLHYCEGDTKTGGTWKVSGRNITAVITTDLREHCRSTCAAGPANVSAEECRAKEKCDKKSTAYRETYTYRILADSSVELKIEPPPGNGQKPERYPCIQRFE